MILFAVLLAGLLAAGVHADSEAGIPSPRAEFERMAYRLEQSDNPYLGKLQVPRLRQALARPDQTQRQRLRLRADLSSHLLRLGDVEAAITEIEAAHEEATGIADLEPSIWSILHFRRAVAYWRRAEDLNCVLHNDVDSCLLPVRGGGIHREPVPGLQALASLRAGLELEPRSLSLRWLLNLTAMFVGVHPDSVPPAWLIPDAALAAEADIGRFVDIAHQLGVGTFNLCGGVIVEDFDGDGYLDILTSTYDPRGPLTYYGNTGDGSFVDLSAATGLDQQLGGLNIVAADYDNDGDADVLVLRGAWLFDDGRMRNSLLRNEGGHFADITRAVGLASPERPTQAAAWADVDGDGWLDLFIGNESRVETAAADGDYPSQLFLNRSGERFDDVAPQAGLTNDRYCKGVTAGDYDNDGDIDLYASNVGRNRLYRNDGDGTFEDVAPALHVTGPEGRSFAPWFFDMDNDGWLDLFVAAYDSDIGDVAAAYLELPHDGVAPRLYHNDRGRFVDIATAAGLDWPWLPMGANFGDLDNDGFLDIYLATGDPEYQTLTPNAMLRNDGGVRFQDVTASGGFGHLQKGHGVAFADIDNDGDQDLYHQLGGFYPGDAYHNALFLNPGHGHHFVVIELAGRQTNRSGYGARIRVTTRTGSGLVTFHRAVGSVSSFGGSPARQEVGLGAAHAIDSIEVYWPVSGTTSRVEDVPLDSRIRITEEVPGYDRLTFAPIRFDLGGAH